VTGYFAMPVLAKERVVGLVDPKRTGTTLHARHVVVHDARAVNQIALALREAATWVACDRVVIERVTPDEVSGALHAVLAS
jgi:uncharacterized protein YcaQ